MLRAELLVLWVLSEEPLVLCWACALSALRFIGFGVVGAEGVEAHEDTSTTLVMIFSCSLRLAGLGRLDLGVSGSTLVVLVLMLRD